MSYYNMSPLFSTEMITNQEKNYIEQIALKFFNATDKPSEWYAGLTKNLESSLLKHKAFGAFYTSINMDEKKYAAYLKSLLVKKYGFEGNTKGKICDESTIVYIYKRAS